MVRCCCSCSGCRRCCVRTMCERPLVRVLIQIQEKTQDGDLSQYGVNTGNGHFHCVDVVQSGAASFEDDGGDKAVVFFLCTPVRSLYILHMAIQMDTFFLHDIGHCVHRHKYNEAGNT